MLLGSGHMGEVFALSESVVAKLFYLNTPKDIVQYEVDMTKCAQRSPVNVVDVGEIFEHEGRFGIYFQRVYGISALDACLNQPWRLFSYAKAFAHIHKTFHKTKIEFGRQQKEELSARIKSVDILSDKLKNIALERLSELEDGSSLCHGDFHLNNILKEDDHWTVIDWGGAMRGNPIADVAHTSMLLSLGELPRDASFFARLSASVFRKIFSKLYLYYYFNGQKEKMAGCKKWLLPLAFARLASRNEAELKKLKKLIKKELEK